MYQNFKPTWTIEALYDLEVSDLEKHHLKGVLVDLDNTLVAWNNPDGTPELKTWIKKMQEANIPVLVVSNNKSSRIKRVVESLGLIYVSRAMKPFTAGLKKAQETLEIPKENLVMVGDQLVTDILGANRFGVASILVKPIVDSDSWNTKFNRFIEGKIKNKLYENGIKWERNL